MSKAKRPLTPFFRFSGEYRAEIKAKHPDWKAPDISKELGRRWKAMSDDQKQPYIDQYQKEKGEAGGSKSKSTKKGKK